VKSGSKRIGCNVLFFALSLCVTIQHAHAKGMAAHAVGEAMDLNSNDPLYREIHCLSSDALAREVIYRDVDDQLIAHKFLNYETGRTTPSFMQHNFYSRESFSVELQQEKLILAFQQADGRPPAKSVSIRPNEELPLVIDAGFDTFVTDHWDGLVDGESKSFQFPFAGRETLVELRITSSSCSYDTETDQCFNVELNNWFLKILAAPIELGYDAKLKRLARFRGLSNIGNAKGEGQVVDIRYIYQDLPALACNVNDFILNESAVDAEISALNNEGRRL